MRHDPRPEPKPPTDATTIVGSTCDVLLAIAHAELDEAFYRKQAHVALDTHLRRWRSNKGSKDDSSTRMAACIALWKEQGLSKGWNSWMETTRGSNSAAQTQSNALNRWVRQGMTGAWFRWHNAVAEARHHQEVMMRALYRLVRKARTSIHSISVGFGLIRIMMYQ